MLFDGVEVLDFAGPFEVFGVAGWQQPRPPFDVYTVSVGRSEVSARNGLRVGVDYPSAAPEPDVLVIPGGFGTRRERHNPALIEFIGRTAASAGTVLTVCTGALLAADAGLLAGKDATTHIGAVDELAACKPAINVHGQARIVDNGDIVCSAGISAGIDASLYLVSKLTSPDLAADTADYMQYDWSHRTPDGRAVIDATTSTAE